MRFVGALLLMTIPHVAGIGWTPDLHPFIHGCRQKQQELNQVLRRVRRETTEVMQKVRRRTKEKLESLRQQKEEKQQEKRELKEILKRARRRSKEKQEKLDLKQQKLERQQEEKEEIQEILRRVRQRTRDKQATIDLLTQDNHRLQEQVERLQSEKRELEASVDEFLRKAQEKMQLEQQQELQKKGFVNASHILVFTLLVGAVGAAMLCGSSSPQPQAAPEMPDDHGPVLPDIAEVPQDVLGESWGYVCLS